MKVKSESACRSALTSASLAALVLLSGCASTGTTSGRIAAGGTIPFHMQKGPLADYGASPWYTQDIAIDGQAIKLAIDNGANFQWATGSDCNTDACNQHQKVNMNKVIPRDREIQPISFGPWGTMLVTVGETEFVESRTVPPAMTPQNLILSRDYKGNKFGTLAWAGGIGMPSESSNVWKSKNGVPSGFYFDRLLRDGVITQAKFAMVFNQDTGVGKITFGGADASDYYDRDAGLLPPKKIGSGLEYLWATDLVYAELGNTIVHIKDNNLILDSGSSHFKGSSENILPILERLEAYKTPEGKPIFERVYDEDSKWIGLKYRDGKSPRDYPNLPDFDLAFGKSCNGTESLKPFIRFSPEQYSYKVDVGDRAGEWVVAFQVLEGVPGLLVGSTLLDLVHTTYEYRGTAGNLSQGDMWVHPKQNHGPGPKVYGCHGVY